MAVLEGGRLASGSGDRTIKIWEPSTAQQEKLLTTAPTLRLSIAPAPAQSIVEVWERSTGACVATLDGHRHSDGNDHRQRVQASPLPDRQWAIPRAFVLSLAVLEDGRLASGSGDRTIKIWDSTLTGVL